MATVFGVEIPDLDEEFGTPVDVLCVVKCLKPEDSTSGDGTYQLVVRSSRIPTWEAYGMAAWVQKVAFDEDLYDGSDDG